MRLCDVITITNTVPQSIFPKLTVLRNHAFEEPTNVKQRALGVHLYHIHTALLFGGASLCTTFGNGLISGNTIASFAPGLMMVCLL